MRSMYNWLLVLAMTTGCGVAAVPASGPAPVQELHAVSVPVVETSVVDVPTAVVADEPAVAETDRQKAVEWMVGFMTRHAPPGRTTFYAEAQETKEEALERYHGIANAVVDVVYNPETKPVFGGPNGRARSSAVILAIMLFESGFMKNVDYGVGKFGRGDAGKSWCLLQLNVGAGRTIKWNKKFDRVPRMGDDQADIFEGYTGPELVGDRRKCIGEAYKALRLSFGSCRSMQLPLDQKLRVFGSGNCNGAVKESRLRMKAALKFWDDTHKTRGFKDDAVLASVAKSLGLPAAGAKPVDGPAPLPILPNSEPKNEVPEPIMGTAPLAQN